MAFDLLCHMGMRFWINQLKFIVLFVLVIVAKAAVIDTDVRGVASAPHLRNWGLFNRLSNSHIHAPEAWKIEKGSHNIVVAIIDTGIDANHLDLKHNLWKDYASGYYGWDFVKNKPNPIDEHGHGTHVAGIVGAAMNPLTGISGVAHKVSIMAVKYYSDQNSGTQNLQNSIRALNWAIDHGANIINYSGGGPEFSGEEYITLQRARDKGVLVVAAAGNEHQNTDLVKNYYYPCAYKRLTNIICVAAVNIRNELLTSSNWGKTNVDVAAPGENILSTVPGGKYSYMSGTSQATAFVTGLAALILSKNNELRPEQIRDIIRASVDKVSSLKDKVFSAGKINAFAALQASMARTEIFQRNLSNKKKPLKKPPPSKVVAPSNAIGLNVRKAAVNTVIRSQNISSNKNQAL